MKTAYIINLPASYGEFVHITAPIGAHPRGTHFKGYNQTLIKVSRFLEKEFMPDDFKLNHDHIIFTDKKKASDFSKWLDELDCKEPRKTGNLFYGMDDFSADHGTINFMFNFMGEDTYMSEEMYHGRNELAEFIWKTLDDASVKRYWMIGPQILAFEDRNDGLLARTILEKAIPEFRQEKSQRKAGMTIGGSQINSGSVTFNPSYITANNISLTGYSTTELDKAECSTYKPEVTVSMRHVNKMVNRKLKKLLRKKKRQ